VKKSEGRGKAGAGVAARKPVKVSFDLPEDAPRLVQAASLSLAILAYVKKHTYADLKQAVSVGERITLDKMRQIDLSDEQKALLSAPDVAPVMNLVIAKIDVKDKRDQNRSVAVCPECGEWILTGTSAPGRCYLTDDCPGSFVKASRARKHKPASAEPQGSEE